MIRSRVNELNGWLTVWWEERDDSMPPIEAALAYQRYIVESGAKEGIVGNEDPRVAEALLTLPGFTPFGEDYVYSRPWPSGVRERDMTGIRITEKPDVETISRILKESFGEPAGGLFPPSRIEGEIFSPGWYNILLIEGDDAVGFGSAIHDGEDGVLNFVAVLPSAQGRGLGKRLMDILLFELDSVNHNQIVLSVGGENTSAIRLYEKYGFKRTSGPEVHVKFSQR